MNGGIKRKLNLQSIENKYLAIKEVENGANRKDVCEKFSVKHNTLSGWMKDAETIKKNYLDCNCAPKQKKMKNAKFVSVEEVTSKWFYDAQTANSSLSIDREMIIGKAKEFATKLGIENFEATNGWFSRFKDRHNISYKKICGEAKSADLSQIDDWVAKLTEIRFEYKADDIYNADKTALFYKCIPEKSYCIKSQPCIGGKQSKERISILLTANMSGNDKMQIVVIGKSMNPRCFKNVKHLPVDYYANSKAWMTSDIFSKWIKKVDRTMRIQGRKIVLLVDNCSAHPHCDDLQNVKLVFLPPNTTSLLQPMDQGIIQNFKHHYRKLLAHKKLAAIEQKEDFNENLLGALHNVKKAWGFVEPATILNCFMHAFYPENDEFHGFLPSDIYVHVPTDPEEESLFEAFGLEKNDFVKLAVETDEQEQCRATLDDDEIIESIHVQSKLSSSDSVQIDDTSNDTEIQLLPHVSCRDAFSMCDNLTRFFSESNSATINGEANIYLEKLQRLIAREQLTRLKQTKLKE